MLDWLNQNQDAVQAASALAMAFLTIGLLVLAGMEWWNARGQRQIAERLEKVSVQQLELQKKFDEAQERVIVLIRIIEAPATRGGTSAFLQIINMSGHAIFADEAILHVAPSVGMEAATTRVALGFVVPAFTTDQRTDLHNAIRHALGERVSVLVFADLEFLTHAGQRMKFTGDTYSIVTPRSGPWEVRLVDYEHGINEQGLPYIIVGKKKSPSTT